MPKFPYEIRDVVGSEKENIDKFYSGLRGGTVQVGPHKYLLHRTFNREAEVFYNVEVKADDVWTVGFPKSGLSWMSELIWLLSNNLDSETAGKLYMCQKVNFFEHPTMMNDDVVKKLLEENKDASDMVKANLARSTQPGEVIERLKDLPSPRRIQSSLPLSLLPPNLLEKAKVIYMARHPKDAAVSFYHNLASTTTFGFEGDFEEFWEFTENGLVPWGPQIQHVKEAWDLRDNKNLLFLFYEDLVKDLPGGIRKVAAFLNRKLTDEDVKKLAAYLDFDNMKAVQKRLPKQLLFGLEKKPGFEYFRRGKVGGNPEFTEELNRRADKWVEERSQSLGIKFPSL